VEHFLLARVQDVSGEDEAPESSSDKQAAESDGSHIAIRALQAMTILSGKR
jgi:hypothetical protein